MSEDLSRTQSECLAEAAGLILRRLTSGGGCTDDSSSPDQGPSGTDTPRLPSIRARFLDVAEIVDTTTEADGAGDEIVVIFNEPLTTHASPGWHAEHAIPTRWNPEFVKQVSKEAVPDAIWDHWMKDITNDGGETVEILRPGEYHMTSHIADDRLCSVFARWYRKAEMGQEEERADKTATAVMNLLNALVSQSSQAEGERRQTTVTEGERDLNRWYFDVANTLQDGVI